MRPYKGQTVHDILCECDFCKVGLTSMASKGDNMKIKCVGEVVSVRKETSYAANYSSTTEQIVSTVSFKLEGSKFGGTCTVEGEYKIGDKFTLTIEEGQNGHE